MVPQDISIVFFDGVCILCNSSVQLILKNDCKQYFYFATLQSDVAKEVLLHLPEEIRQKDSIILRDKGRFYVQSAAALRIAYQLGSWWYLTQILWIFPTFFRDYIYGLIARNRYKWFGKKEQCMLPDPKWTARFL